MIDVNVLTGADIRRIDGKYGKISKVSLPWVTVEWANGESATYKRSDEALSEDIELKTLDKGWVSLGAVVGIEEGKEQEVVPSIDESQKPIGELLAEMTLLRRQMLMSEATKGRKVKAKANVTAMLAKKASEKKAQSSGGKKSSKKKEAPKGKHGGANDPNPYNPFHNYASLGNHSPEKVKRSQKKIWKCKAGEGGQRCVAKKAVPEQGIKKGTVKIITKWAGKGKWKKRYEKGRKNGTYKLPNGAVEPVTHPYYTGD